MLFRNMVLGLTSLFGAALNLMRCALLCRQFPVLSNFLDRVTFAQSDAVWLP